MKKQEEIEQDLDGEVVNSGSARPARNSGTKRKSASHSSSKRKRSKAARRKGNTTGGMHQRGDKRVLR